MTLRPAHLSVDFFLIAELRFHFTIHPPEFSLCPQTIIIVRCCIIPLDHLTYSSSIHTDMEVIKLMYPYYSSSLVSENHIFPFTLQVMTSELTELHAAAMVWSLCNNIFMFICAPPSTMEIVSPDRPLPRWDILRIKNLPLSTAMMKITLCLCLLPLTGPVSLFWNFLKTTAQAMFFWRLKLHSIKW